MYLRCGTLLRMFQEEFNEPLTTFAKRIETAETTINSFQTGHRHPSPESVFLFKFQRFLTNSIDEMKIDTAIEIEQYALNAIYLEHYFSNIHENMRLLVQKAALDTLLSHLKLLTNDSDVSGGGIMQTGTGDSIKAIFKSDSKDSTDKLVIALYLARLAMKNGLILEYGDYVIQRPFRDLSELVESAGNSTLITKWPLTVDILMSLPVSVDFQFNMQELFKAKVLIKIDESISPSLITSEGHIFPAKKDKPQAD